MSHGVCGQPDASQCKPVYSPTLIYSLLTSSTYERKHCWSRITKSLLSWEVITFWCSAGYSSLALLLFSLIIWVLLWTWSIIYLRFYQLDDTSVHMQGISYGCDTNNPARLFAVPALMDLKTAWNSNNALDSWQSNSSCSAWQGLTCDGSNYVTSMWAVLNGYNLNLLLFFNLQLM